MLCQNLASSSKVRFKTLKRERAMRSSKVKHFLDKTDRRLTQGKLLTTQATVCRIFLSITNKIEKRILHTTVLVFVSEHGVAAHRFEGLSHVEAT